MKIHCPVHNDSTPSMEIYEEFGHCFSCGAHIPIGELGLEETKERKEKTKENLHDKILYISGLSRRIIRGLLFPYDSRGYYIVWPDNTYYKLRATSGSGRYVGPNGHKPTLYVIKGSEGTVVVVEGEL